MAEIVQPSLIQRLMQVLGMSQQPVAYTRATRTPIVLDENPHNLAHYDPTSGTIGIQNTVLQSPEGGPVLRHEMVHQTIPFSIARQFALMKSPQWADMSKGMRDSGYSALDATKEVPAFGLSSGFIPNLTLADSKSVLQNIVKPKLTDEQLKMLKKIGIK